MEKVDLEAQEASNFVDPNMVGIDHNQASKSFIKLKSPEMDESTKVFEMDTEGNVTLWNPEGFVQLCEQSEDPTLKAMLAIYNLGIIEGCRVE